MQQINLELKNLERPAAVTMLESLTGVVSTAAANPFLKSFAGALDLALNQKAAAADDPPVMVHGKLESLSDLELGQVVTAFNLFLLSFEFIGFQNATKFCARVCEICGAEILGRLARRNPPSRVFPSMN